MLRKRPANPQCPLSNRRKSGRVRCELVGSSLGRVADLSAGGMRVLRRTRPVERPGERLLVTVRTLERTLTVAARVSWVDKQGLFRVEVGVEFIELTPELREALTQAARTVSTNSDFISSINKERAA
ncbi:MAG TPA: hypothetical protein DEB06_06830 [Phycisphaerales bacterium]|nr:hypothetical protein [Phycisphaerales bacterium]